MSRRIIVFLALLLMNTGVQAGTSGNYQDLRAIQAAAESHARAQARSLQLQDVQVKAQQVDRRLRLAPCGSTLQTTAPVSGLSGRTTVEVTCPGPRRWALYVPVQVVASVSAITIANTLPRGTILSRSDLIVSKRLLTSLRKDYVADYSLAVGKQLKRPVRAGNPLYQHMLAVPNAVERGQATQLLVSMDTIQVEMEGVALASGALGDLIKVRNNSSGRTLEGVVTGDGQVRIQ